MKYYIGIDGGGTKTSIAIGDDKGDIHHNLLYPGCSYQEIGMDSVVSLLSKAVNEILSVASIKREDCIGCCIGLPCYGENAEQDQIITENIERELSPIPIYIVNDAVVGWAGSLNCKEGIHLVAGTGSIAIGFDSLGNFARCGGWSEHFSDEGSCYWIGKQIMQLFSKEADGRIPKSPIYHIIREIYHLENDYDFIDSMTKEVLPYRDKVALLQKIALSAADANDSNVKKIYDTATEELSQMILGVKNKLLWSEEPVKVSYYGGLFHAEEYVIPKLDERLNRIKCSLTSPEYGPTEGAVRLAIKKFQEVLDEQNNIFGSR